MERLGVTLLGAFRVSRGDSVLPIAGARLRALLVRLALAGGHPVDPAVLVDAIWPQDPPAVPTAALHNLVSRLRRALTPTGPVGDLIGPAPGGYRLAVDPADVDVLRFEALTAAGRERLRAGDPQAARAALDEAVTRWGDRPGAEPAIIAAVAPAVATRLAALSVDAVTDLAEAELTLGRPDTAETHLTRLLTEHPGHEGAAALLMDALAVQGRQPEALAVYDRLRTALADRLGVDPGTALRERHVRLLRTPDSGATVHRTRPPGLPAPTTGFIGRADDLTRVGTRLTSARLVTVIGPGGAGKTRLALEAARRLEPADRVRFVDLAPVTEPAKVAAAVLAGLGLRTGRMFDARNHGPDDDRDRLAAELADRDTVLLLDNCEHLIDAVAHLTTVLLTRCRGLRVLATSREPLAIDGETLVPLTPLTLPDAIRLFLERAIAVRPGFRLDQSTEPDVVRVVTALDGLPLALELAAARLRTLSLPALADGLSDRFQLLSTGSRTAPHRHRTLRAVIAWSWDLLHDHERTVAERIAVLPGGVTAASAAAVCVGTTVPATEIRDLLAALVDRSLLQLIPETGRYRMLETIREYGADRLRTTGDLDTVLDLAAAHFTAFVAGHEPHLRGPGQLTAMTGIRAEYDNTLAALQRLSTVGDPTDLALTLSWYWQMSGRHPDAVHWLGRAPIAATSASDCARALYLLNRAAAQSGISAGEAERDRAEMRELAGRLLATPNLPGHHRVLGPILLFLQDERTAVDSFERLAATDDTWTAALADMFLAEIAENTGALDRMHAHVEAALIGFEQSGDRWARAAVLPIRARLRRYTDLDGAVADLHEARTSTTGFGPPALGDRLHHDLLWIDLHLRRGDTEQAAATIVAARERARRAADPEIAALVDAHDALVQMRLGNLDRARRLVDDAAPATERGRALIGVTRVSLCLLLSETADAEKALRGARVSATGDRPILAAVTVSAAELAEAHGRHHESAGLLADADRLRGGPDRTDPRVVGLTRRLRAVLTEDETAVG
ncbi:BTAD domain-containing putative transcriptional regulator [Actinoplanes sichuanensis]|uniref:BTAD domain-containing putative transcriptional regulator n=1 Tax=Actinoplanes sichuanensis TaxID=512349 RepID=A0ABW4AU73_9ACTN|nr:BTAD domain-containing putative transcriptional regulator [Actinoplanes sichuanensis]BEL05437.1 BTAD domain-containing putative transcriptional regulator [Actinoplanes sichuanensis]